MYEHVLGIDIGNTDTVLGLFCADTSDLEVQELGRIASDKSRSAKEWCRQIRNIIETKSSLARPFASIKTCIYSSVVSELASKLSDVVQTLFVEMPPPIEVRWDMRLNLNFLYPKPQELGIDRIINAHAATVLYPKSDLIIVDMGTALSFCLVHDGKTYLGGCIAPGMKLAMQALERNTDAKHLKSRPIVSRPSRVLGKSTQEALQAGIFFGWIGLVREILKRLKQSDTRRKYKVIATGGLALLMSQECPELFDEVDSLLTLRGLKHIYALQKSKL